MNADRLLYRIQSHHGHTIAGHVVFELKQPDGEWKRFVLTTKQAGVMKQTLAAAIARSTDRRQGDN